MFGMYSSYFVLKALSNHLVILILLVAFEFFSPNIKSKIKKIKMITIKIVSSKLSTPYVAMWPNCLGTLLTFL